MWNLHTVNLSSFHLSYSPVATQFYKITLVVDDNNHRNDKNNYKEIQDLEEFNNI